MNPYASSTLLTEPKRKQDPFQFRPNLYKKGLLDTSVSFLSQDNSNTGDYLLKNEKAQITKLNEILTKSQLDLRRQVRELENSSQEKQQIAKNYDNLKIKNNELQKALTSSSQHNSELKRTFNLLERKVNEVNETNKNLTDKLNEVKKDYDVKLQENTKLKNRYEHLLSKYEREYQVKQKEIRNLNEKNNTITEETAELDKKKRRT